MSKLKLGDLVRVRYIENIEYVNDLNDTEIYWTEPFHGVILETPDMGPTSVCRMWCFEREQEHILRPSKDSIEILSAVDDITFP